MLNYMLLTVVVNGHNCVAVRTVYGDGRQRNATCRTNRARFVRHVASVTVLRRSVCERCRGNQRARTTYGAVCSVNGVLLLSIFSLSISFSLSGGR